ncbi:MAG: glycerophosphodiester phosphodiesterase [Cognaticolwellia sp.]
MKIIAHRGASGEFPENSLLAFEQALLQGCDGIEFDAQYHQPSGEFILLHDSYLNYQGKQVHFNQLPLSVLLNLSADTKRNICTLTQALRCIGEKTSINIELKSAAQGQQLREEMTRLAEVIQQAEQQKLIHYQQIIVSAFNHHILIDISQRLPEITTAALIACCPVDYAAFCQKLPVEMLNISINCINQALVSDAQRRGLKVWVFTVDNPAQIQQCFQYQVDGIFTNFPKRSRQVMSALK